MLKILLNFLLICSIAFVTVETQAQSLSGTDLSTINIDDLTDQDILNYIKEAENRGFTQAQVEALARQRGMTEIQISKLRRRVEQLRLSSSGANQKLENTQQLSTGRNETTLDDDVFGMLVESERSKSLTDEQKKIFGFDLFNSENLTFAPNLNIPTPEDYVIGPGDELIIDLWGTTQANLRLFVSTEGTVRPENLSPIYINGLSIKAAEEKIIERLSEINSGLKSRGGQRATIFYQVSLGNIRTINVTIVGEVNSPGNYALNSLSTVFTALHAAAGPNENGTFRSIQLIRNNKLKAEIDLYDFLIEGIKKGDERLKNGDVIIVKPYKARVEIEGEVRRPGIFELEKGEDFEDLLEYTGGFTSSAYRSLVTVKRSGNREREVLDVEADQFETFIPRNGDVFEVSPILERYSNRVQIEGAIHREGEYQLTDGLTLKQLIEKADGLRGDAFLNRATIYRMNEDFSQDVLPIDLTQLMSGVIPDVPLVREDLVRISSIYDLKEEYIVQISGEVIEGGVYPFFNQMTVQDLIILSRGLTEGASGAIIEISRRNKNGALGTSAEIITLQIDKTLSLINEDRNLLLEPFDQVYVRRSPGYTVQQQVTVEGEVLAPGVYSINRKNERISDIIKRAKGLTPYAYPQGAILIRKTEFSSGKSNDEINQEYLQQLRDKLLSDESELKNISQTRLIERLNTIQTKNTDSNETDAIGSRVKKELVQDIQEQDSLISEVKIKEEEPTVLDLIKILENPGSKYDFLVREGDVISIPPELETVRVTGEVISPLNVRFEKTFSFKDYINDAGGFTARAKKGRSYIQYPNGRKKQTRRFLFFKFYPKVEPGSTIFVSRKPERQGLSPQAWISIGTGIATLGLVTIQAIRLIEDNNSGN